MRAPVGDRLRIHSNQVGAPDHRGLICGLIVEIRRANGAPPYLALMQALPT